MDTISEGGGDFSEGLCLFLYSVGLIHRRRHSFSPSGVACSSDDELCVISFIGQVPSSWESYVEGLPVLDPEEFSDLRPIAGHLQKKPIVVMFLEKPSAKLSDFLKLSATQRREGIVVKAKSTAQRTAKEVGFEMFAHQVLADGLPFALPSLGAYRDVDTETVYLITPRARADVGEYTRAMPDKVNIKLAWAEMIWSLWAMHKRGWVHRDIKSFNYFVSQDGHALLADFEGYWLDGMYAIIYGEESEIIFTDRYVAPEMTFDEEYQLYDAKGDVFALGVTFKEMMRWMSGVGIPDAHLAKDLVNHMIDANPDKRYSLKECSEHPFFEGIDFEKLETRRYGKAFEGNFFSSYKFI